MSTARISGLHMTNDDLRCLICTKTARFSDISHLLTHISSKQHLSNYFKIRVAAEDDAVSKSLLVQFNSWFETWNMAALLRERMQQKDKKKKGSKPGNRDKPVLSSRAIEHSKPRRKDLTAVRREPSMSADPSMILSPPTFPDLPYGLFNPPMHPLFPPMSTWTAANQDSEAIKEELGSSDDVEPHLSAAQPYFLKSRYHDGVTAEGSSSLHSSAIPDEANNEDADDREMSRLKGTVWPGMDLFDSATPDMQRKRNQKKAVNVVVRLHAASLGIEPEELIYNTAGEFLKVREITGDPATVTSPLKGETTPEPDSVETKKKRGGTRRREALQDLDANVPRRRHSTRRPKQARKKYNEPNSESLDDDITYQAAQYKRRNGIRIHQDDTGPEITFDQNGASTTNFRYRGINAQNMKYRDQAGPMMRPGYPNAYHIYNAPRHGMIGHAPMAYDLSAFGHMNMFTQPTYNGFGHGLPQPPIVPSQPFVPNTQGSVDGRATMHANGFDQNMHNWDVFAPERQQMHGTTTGYPNFEFDHNNHHNPLFLDSDQAFPENAGDAQTFPIKEDEDDKVSNADTISLASNEK